MRPAQDPPWSKVREAAEEIFGSTKDLRAAGILHMALLKTSGLAGLEAGLGLMRHMLERYWDNLFPLRSAGDVLRADRTRSSFARLSATLDA